MSASSEYETAARQNYGPTTSNENVYEHVLEHKLAKNMNVPSVRPPVLRAVALSPTEGDPEPDSTNPENIIQSTHNKIAKENEYHVAKKSETDMSVGALSGIVRIEEATVDTVGCIAYPIVQETEESGDGSYVDNPGATIIQTPINTAIVQNVTKLPQNFTFNVDATVSNITTAIQNVSEDASGNQTLWLPTILTTSTAATDTKSDEERSQTGMSQILIASESYISDGNQPGRRNFPETTFMSSRLKGNKVQILSNVSLPKSSNFSQQYSAPSKEVAKYGPRNHVYKLSTNIVSQKQQNNSVLCNKTLENQSLMTCSTLSPTVVSDSSLKNVSYSHTFSKGTNLKTLNKVNNGPNLNAAVTVSSANTQCHILSRVVSGPNKIAAHPGRKSVNTIKGSKNSQVSSNQKNQSRAIKIIQQTGATHKSEAKSWTAGSVGTFKNQQQKCGVVGTKTSKIIQKVGSPTPKNQQQMPLQKVPSKTECLVLQSPCGPVLLSTAALSVNMSKGPHYVQSGSATNLRYVHTYGSSDSQLATVSQVSANQQLTAQILQSLSQPKLMLQHNSTTLPVNNHVIASAPAEIEILEEPVELKPVTQKRIVFGDKSTLFTTDDTVGAEERPSILEALRRYSCHSLAFAMIDHTYALPLDKQSPVSTPTTTVAPLPPAIVSSPIATAPMSPMKRNSPVIVSTASFDLPVTVPTSVILPPVPASTVQMAAINYKPAPLPLPPQEDDAASVISSIDGERQPGDRGGSDTETAPEGEEEGKTRCVCNFTHDDGYMICCDRCGEWQHVDCMGIDRQNIPDAYMCEMCQPRTIDRRHARAIQLRKREELNALGASDSDSSECSRPPGQRRKRLLTVTTYTITSGSCVTTYNSSLPALPPLPQPTLTLPKRGPKRPKKPEVIRKGTKRKLSEKRVKRKKDLMLNRSKYNSNVSNQSHWQESYELAMTNHYSPELRAKIMKYSSKLGLTPNMAAAITAHLCTTVPHAGGKILIATKDLRENTPVIELRGKYMLSNQHRPQLQNSARAGSQKPGPFVFFYRLPKDNTQICIDTRTYGNEARFVRRSCKPNAELQHCIVKGTLHVYLVTIGVIQSNTEITVGHDSTGSKQPCACGNPKHCKINGINPLMTRKNLDYPREKRSRTRYTSSSSPASPPISSILPSPVKEEPSPVAAPIKVEKKSPIKCDYTPLTPINTLLQAPNFDEPIKTETEVEEKPDIDITAKEELKSDLDEPDFVKIEPKVQEPQEAVKSEPEPDLKPKVEETKPEIKIEKEPLLSDEEKPPKIKEKLEEKKQKEPKVEEERPITREYMAKSACHDRSSRSSRTVTCTNQDSLDDKTDDSQDKLQTTQEKDKKKMNKTSNVLEPSRTFQTREERKMEAIMKAIERMERAEQRKMEVKERQKRRESDPHPNAADKEEDDEVHNSTKKRKRRRGRARTTSQSNRRRLNSADSDMMTSGDEPGPISPPPRSDPHPHAPSNTDRADSLNEDLGLSSACLLVEAAVGSVESAFKLPKTKKTMATEWVGRSPERTPSPYRSPYRPSLVSATSLESLVKVASTMIGDLSGGHETDDLKSPPRTPVRDRSRPPKKAKRITRSTPAADVTEMTETAPTQTQPQHSAKKRWLRQAISEESDSPNADAFISESPPNEMVTPLKKRRLARESLSCEPNTVVPCDDTSPNLTSEESPVKEDSAILRQYKVRNIMENLYGRDRTRSDSGQGSDDQCNMDSDLMNVNIKPPHDSEDIRRIIGVPTPEDEMPPVIIKPEDIKTNNNNVEMEECNYNKVVPMEIDTTITPIPTKISEPIEIKDVDSPKLNSADTSGNSSPQRDEMDDIQKKIHSFHTENILMLKSRNKKPPKEKRKKVNLNFDLNMVDDRISVQLRTDEDSSEINGDIHENPVLDNIPLPPVESIPLPEPETIPLPEEPTPVLEIPPPETIPLPEEPLTPVQQQRTHSPIDLTETLDTEKNVEKPSVLDTDSTAPFLSRFNTSRLFSGLFNDTPQSYLDNPMNENVPNIIKSAIDRTTLDNSLFDKDSITPVDDLKSVREILNRVNNMDSSSSVILSGVLKSSNQSGLLTSTASSSKPASKSFTARCNDPRLNPPPVDKPKPVRRKLSITEYRKRHKGTASEDSVTMETESGDTMETLPESSESSGGSELSPQRLDVAAAVAMDDLEQRLHRDLTTTHVPKGVFDAEPTASERQREKLSSRLRREFGLALPEDEEARPPTEIDAAATTAKRCDR